MFEEEQKYLPFSKEAEQSVLASLLHGGALPLASALISPDDFYEPINAHLFELIVKLDENKSAIDVMTLINSIEEHGVIDKSEGLRYVVELNGSMASEHNLETYAKTVLDFSNERQILKAARDMMTAIIHGEGSSQERQNTAMSLFHSIDTEAHVQKHMKEQVAEFIEGMDKKMEVKTEITGLPTGLDDLDKATGGFQDSDFVIMAARPAMGKTTLGVNTMVKAAKGLASKAGDDGLVMIFSMEMPADQLIGRMFAAEGGISMSAIKSPGLFFTANDGTNYQAAAGKIMPLMNNMVIDDRPALTPQQVRAACLSAERKYKKPVRGVLIDYVQIMSAPGEDTQRIGTCSKALKALAMELKCPVVSLAQLNRDVEKRTDKRPKSSDLKGSGQLEQDADIIILIHSDDDSDEIDRKNGSDEGYAILIIDKFRAGVCTDVLVRKELSYSRFKTHETSY